MGGSSSKPGTVVNGGDGGSAGPGEAVSGLAKFQMTASIAEQRLPRVTWRGPGVLSLEGMWYLFASAVPLNLEWLAGSLSADEFSSSVSRINAAVVHAAAASPKARMYEHSIAGFFGPLDTKGEEAALFNAASAVVAVLNAELAHRGIRFVLDNGLLEFRKMFMDTSLGLQTFPVKYQRCTLHILVPTPAK